MTVPEMLVAAGLFLVITTALLSSFFRGIEAWKQVEQRSVLMNEAQKVFRDVSWELESSSLQTVEWSNSPGILTFASPFGPRDTASRDQFQVDNASGDLRWDKYVVLYRDALDNTVKKREIPIPGGSAARLTPQVISTVDLGSGTNPPSYYANSGLVVSRDAEMLTVGRLGRSVELTLVLKNQDGRSGEFVYSVLVRN